MISLVLLVISMFFFALAGFRLDDEGILADINCVAIGLVFFAGSFLPWPARNV